MKLVIIRLLTCPPKNIAPYLLEAHLAISDTAANKILLHLALNLNFNLASIDAIIYPPYYISRDINLSVFTTLQRVICINYATSYNNNLKCSAKYNFESDSVGEILIFFAIINTAQ